MSVYSMTGYASLQTPAAPNTDHSPQVGLPRIGLELRSVNSRFLDLSFKLCDELRGSESQLRDLLTQKLVRGKVELRAYVIHQNGDNASPKTPTSSALQQLARLQAQVQVWMPNAQALSVADVLRLSGGQAQTTEPTDSLNLLQLAEQALAELLASRAREGSRLATMLRAHCAQLRRLVSTAQPLIPDLVATQQQRFIERFSNALEQADPGGQIASHIAHERALIEATAYAIRVDVAEELTRLNAHLDEVDHLLTEKIQTGQQTTQIPRSTIELGKRLDFIIQELHREANTLGSKSSTLELSRISVDMKVLIEQMREQVQNIQ
jgi:uncharacterized protein (TIGR00255 family)